MTGDVELVFSTLIHPKALVGNTFRQQNLREGIKCQSRPWFSCIDEPNCPLSGLYGFFENSSCTNDACATRPFDVLHRHEQKVVDTMMVADLACANDEGYQEVCVVSRDDDIWPGLCLAARTAQNLLHITTAKSLRVPRYYQVLASPPYHIIQWT